MCTKMFLKSVAALSLSLCAVTVHAQNTTGTGHQPVSIGLSNIVEIGFLNTNSNTGNIIGLTFQDVNDYMNGVESDEQMLRVRSNKNFDVRVKASSSKFSYTGNATITPDMYVSNVLTLKVTENNTGGTVTSGYGNYKSLSSSGKKIINNGDAGNNQTFAIKYKATPGFNFPTGTYTVDVVFTVTAH